MKHLFIQNPNLLDAIKSVDNNTPDEILRGVKATATSTIHNPTIKIGG